MGPSSGWCGSRSWPPRNCPTGSRTPCATATRPGWVEAGADLRWVKDQLGHASIEETESTYGHLERERHERRVDLDRVLGGVQPRPPASTLLDAGGATEGQLHYTSREVFMVEGKGFVGPCPPFPHILRFAPLHEAA